MPSEENVYMRSGILEEKPKIKLKLLTILQYAVVVILLD